MTRSTAARIPPAAPRGARRNTGESTAAHVLDRIESAIAVTTFRDLNPFCSSIAACGRPFAVRVHESMQTQLAALTHALLASSAVHDQRTIGQLESDK
jgi:hypothetical protein